MKSLATIVALLLTTPAGAALQSEIGAHASPMIAGRSQNIRVICNHGISVTNTGDKNVLARAYYELCADLNKCQISNTEQMIIPGATWVQTYQTYNDVFYNYPGTYQYTCSTSVRDSASKTDISSIQIM